VVSLGIFFVVPPTEPRALRSTQPLKVSTRYLSWGKCGRCVWLTTYHPCSAEMSRKSGALIYPEPLGPPRPVAGDLYFTFTITCKPCATIITTMIPSYEGIPKDWKKSIVSRFRLLTDFISGSPRDCKSFPLKRNFRSSRFLFTTGFTV